MYREDDVPDATDLYGRTKLLGETNGPGALTLRTSIIGRELATASGLVEWFLSERGKRVKGYTKAIYTGFTTQAMARILRTILTEHADLSGTIQVSSDPISKHDLLVRLANAMRLDTEIMPDGELRIDRSLDSTRFRLITHIAVPGWDAMIEELAADSTPYEQWKSARPSIA
jgi:dTDP-4-dehydrorhamnose reductase